MGCTGVCVLEEFGCYGVVGFFFLVVVSRLDCEYFVLRDLLCAKVF